MNNATKNADLIRADIADLRNKYFFLILVASLYLYLQLADVVFRHAYIPGNQKCSLCDLPAISRHFYLFPCQHTFHSDCLAREVR